LIYNQWCSQYKSDTDSYDSRISKIWTFIRNSKWTFDAEQFQQSLALVNCCMSLVYVCVCISKQQIFTPLYRGVKDMLEIASTSKRVVWNLIKITNDLLPNMIIIVWRINFKFFPSLEEHWCRHSYFSCPVVGTKQSGGDSGCTLRTIVLCQLSPTKKHPMPSNPFELAVALFFQSSAMLDEIKSYEQPLKL